MLEFVSILVISYSITNYPQNNIDLILCTISQIRNWHRTHFKDFPAPYRLLEVSWWNEAGRWAGLEGPRQPH